MNRRELIKMIAAVSGTAFVGGSALLAGCVRSVPRQTYEFTAEDISFLDEVAETILPRTDTPGAKDAEVGKLMTVIVNDCYSPQEQLMFHRGMTQIKVASVEHYNADFMSLNQDERLKLIENLNVEAKQHNLVNQDSHYFSMILQLTLFGFFTSKVGATEVLRYMAIPGRYDGCMPYEKGDRAWATR